MEKNLTKEEARKILDEIKEDNDLSLLKEKIKDNSIEFEYDGKLYRVKLLNVGEKELLNNLKIQKFGELIQNKNILSEKDLKESYKLRGIDIYEMEDKIKKLRAEKMQLELRLGEAIHNKIDEKALTSYRDKISELNDEIYILLIRINNLLSYSLENQLASYVYKILAFLSLEVKINDKWRKVFNTMEEFNNSTDEKLIEKAIFNASLIN